MTKVEWGIIAVIVVILAAIFIGKVTRLREAEACAMHGFPDIRVTAGDTYCVKRTERGADSVVSLKALR